MSEDEIKYSSQVAIVDNDGNLYLENNTHLGKLAFFGGTREGAETSIQTAIRELKEELGIIISPEDLTSIGEDGPREFPKGRYISHLYVLKIGNDIAELLKNRDLVFVMPRTRLNNNDNNYAFAFDRAEFAFKIESVLGLNN